MYNIVCRTSLVCSLKSFVCAVLFCATRLIKQYRSGVVLKPVGVVAFEMKLGQPTPVCLNVTLLAPPAAHSFVTGLRR